MKRKLLTVFLAVITVLTCALCFTACGGNHEHSYGRDWETNEKYHWHECTAKGNCNAKQIDLDIHSDRDNDGTCDVCKYSWSNTGNPETVPVTGITLNESSATLEIGEQITLTATVKPESATDKTVNWQSDKPEIAKVENGKITAVAEGKAIITATAGEKSATCTVTVSAPTPDELAEKRFMFNRAEVIAGDGLSASDLAMINSGLQGNYVEFRENNKAYIYGFVVCGENARYERIGIDIRIYTYPDEYPDFYWTFTYEGNNITNTRTIDGTTVLYTFTLQTD